jgi:hypothetical protein
MLYCEIPFGADWLFVYQLPLLCTMSVFWHYVLTNKLTNPMKQSPSWEANSHSAIQEILCLLWGPNFHYRVHQSPPLVSILSQLHSIHTFPPYLPKIHPNIILQSTPRFSALSSLQIFRPKFCIHFSSLPCVLYAPPMSSSLTFKRPYNKVKEKFSQCFNWAPRHGCVLGEWRYSSTHSLTSVLDGGVWSASRPGRFTRR